MASSAPDHLRTPGLISNRPCYEGIKLEIKRVKAEQVGSGVLGVEPPVNGGLGGVALGDQGLIPS